ncbi:hypothetical protein [Acetivibrio ethanolgignens]|uniref:Uncharacterized protein n=1 Tax=Acetivibrio ethanolgignens TaxID=290052 RepID=A0A0V8QEZ4_9FIRM|nr:hypothetical protein [Acetivibrio ethanolgignens]KSV59157.1 hypothetical protein ASU35_10395 [Acetivibrio ethanolgignens]
MGTTLRTYKFEYLSLDKVNTVVTVDYNTNKVTVKNFTDDIVDTAFGLVEPTIDDLDDFFETRCFDRNRPDSKEILEALGLPYYDPEQIVRRTYGRFTDDYYWLRFDDEQVVWEDVKDIVCNFKRYQS